MSSKIFFFAAILGTFWLGNARGQSFTYTTENSKTTITGFASGSTPSGAVTVPATLGGFNVTEISRSAFKDQTAITSIAFAAPANIIRLGVGAFQGCTVLQSVVLPTGITAVPTGLLQGCTALTSVTIQSGVTSIGASAFAGCRSLGTLTLPTGVNSLGESAFLNCRSLASLTVPGGVTTIPGQLCQGCRALTSLSLPANVTQIGYGAFADCVGLTTLSLPTGVTNIARDAFQGCSSLTSLSVGGVLGALGDRALLDCNALGTVAVDAANSTYSSVNGVLFNKALTTLLLCPAGRTGTYTVPSTVTTVATGAFSHCASLLSVTLPSSVTTLGADAFYYATGFSKLTLSESVTVIGDWALAGCSRLSNITLPASVASIGNDAFHHDRALTYALFNGNAPTMGTSVFDGTNGNFIIYYYANRTGFSAPTWLGYPTSALSTPPALVSWLTQYGYTPGISPLADADGDGVSLLMAYALGLDPSLNLARSLPTANLSNNTLGLTFYGNSPEVSYVVQTSNNLTVWTTEGVMLSAPDASGFRTATIPLVAGESARFARLIVGF